MVEKCRELSKESEKPYIHCCIRYWSVMVIAYIYARLLINGGIKADRGQ